MEISGQTDWCGPDWLFTQYHILFRRIFFLSINLLMKMMLKEDHVIFFFFFVKNVIFFSTQYFVFNLLILGDKCVLGEL